MDWLWTKFSELYGQKFTSIYGAETDASSLWFQVLSGVTKQDIEKGFNKLIEQGSVWPPSIPEFRDMCKPSDEELGLPMERRAFMDAVNWKNITHQEKNKAVYYAISLIDIFSFQRLTSDKAEKVFRIAWGEVRQFVADNGIDSLPEVPVMIGKTNTDKATDKAKVESELDKMKKELGIKQRT